MSRHPWELTLGDFVERVRRDYGVEARSTADIAGGLYLSVGGLVLALPGMAEDDVLAESVLRSLCRQLHLPPVDFGLDEEEPG